jgi:putative chitinase
MNLTDKQLLGCMPDAGARVPIFLEPLNLAMVEFDISTLQRQAMFLAQVCHESGSLLYMREIHDGSNYDIAVNPTLAMKLGNTRAGDGKKFPGRGGLQVTGRDYTLKCLRALGRQESDVEFLETPAGGMRSAGWVWHDKECNYSADIGNFGTVRKKINGGFNGIDDCIKHYIRIRKVLGI